MKKNNTVDTAKNGQTTNNIQTENKTTIKKDKTPVGKVITISEKESKKKAREEAYRNFRIGALKRRAKRMGLSKEQINEAVKKLIEQMDTPKEYTILVMLSKTEMAMFKEALLKIEIKYNYCGDDFVSINGNQDILAKIREIAPESAKIHPYAKKMESVLPKKEYTGTKKPTNNTTEKKTSAKIVKKQKYLEKFKKRKKNRRTTRPYAKKRKTLIDHKKQHSGKTVQMVNKKPSKGIKTAKKAA